MPSSTTNFLGSNDPLLLIQQCGDLLERKIFQDADFGTKFCAYPMVWACYILPNRDTLRPTVATRDWMKLAEHNYTAIVRCWNVYCSARRIGDICTRIAANGSDGEAFLDLHETLCTFFCCSGGAIDNLRATFRCQPISLRGNADDPVCGQSTEWGSLQWIYDRRTQSVHKVLIPCYKSRGVPCFDTSHFDDSETHWDNAKGIAIQSIDDLIGQIWDRFAIQMNAAWYRLLGHLKETQPSRQAEPAIVNLVRYNVEWSSGLPGHPDGSPCFVQPSGVFHRYGND